jgi:very-short-patch-repair endonuclease
MRRLFTTDEARDKGLTMAGLVWGEAHGRWRRVIRGVYGDGPDNPTPLERAVALVLRNNDVASGNLAGVLHGLDSVELDNRPLRRRRLAAEQIVVLHGIRCTDGLQTVVDLAEVLDDLTWEQALESALRKKLTTVATLEAAACALSATRSRGAATMRRVLALRPAGAPPTESLLETLMVQLVRTVDGIADPTRQVDVENRYGNFVARVDLAWPDLGLFVELDGEKHKGQPVYDATRETAVIAATGWLCGRFTWSDVRYRARTTGRRLREITDQARRRPMAS